MVSHRWSVMRLSKLSMGTRFAPMEKIFTPFSTKQNSLPLRPRPAPC